MPKKRRGTADFGSITDEENFSSTSSDKQPEPITPDREDYAYVPMAYIISAEIENHDIFRDMLVTLFESIRAPAEVTDRFSQNK